MRSTSIGCPFKTSCGHDIDSLRLAIQARHRAGKTDMRRQPDLRISHHALWNRASWRSIDPISLARVQRKTRGR